MSNRRQKRAQAMRYGRDIRRGERVEGVSKEDQAHSRLLSWAEWVRAGSCIGPSTLVSSMGRLVSQKVAAGNRGAPIEMPPGVEQIETLIPRLQSKYKEIIFSYYIEWSEMAEKARDFGLTRTGYLSALRRAQLAVFRELV